MKSKFQSTHEEPANPAELMITNCRKIKVIICAYIAGKGRSFMFCPLLSINNIKSGLDDDKQEYIYCQENKCAWYVNTASLTRRGMDEIQGCAIIILAKSQLSYDKGGV